MPIFNLILAVLSTMLTRGEVRQPLNSELPNHISHESLPANLLTCNCSITQDGNTYPISALMGTETAVQFYDYGVPNISSANTGLELDNALILFLYEEIATGTISLFLIADIANSGTGGSLSFEFNCVPAGAFISVEDDAGEFFGSPPLITGNWSWSTCCTDGGVIENIGCNTSMNLDLLVSSGIDSIVWLTGDITNPDHILLNLTGEAITINCGGGVCCPIGLDTDIMVTDASCPNSNDGEITLNPQDGTPTYSYDWSNGATTSTNTGLVAGTYNVTVTDAQGCSEELAIVVGYTTAMPLAETASMQLCSENTMDVFDLTSVEDIINDGSGFPVLWFQNMDMTGSINTPSNFLSGTTIVYAVVANGPCLSDVVPVNLEILPSPIANTAFMNACEVSNEMAIFNLTTLDGIISSGNGGVIWFLDPNLNDPISDPEEFLSGNATIFAAIDDGSCVSEPVEIDLFVDLKPEGDATEAHLCGDVNNEAVFDLTLLEAEVSGGNGTIDWYLEIELFDLITNPNAFSTTTVTVYAVLFDGICNSDPIPVDLVVEIAPIGNPLTIALCDDGSGEALFNLLEYEAQIGAGGIDWYWDPDFIDPVPNPGALITESTIVFASIDNGICISDPIQVDLVVQESPIGHPTFLETCADSSGQGTFNLTTANTTVSGGTGSVLWYMDVQGTIILNPTNYLSSGSTVYAQINDSVCLSGFVPVDLNIINSVSSTPVQYAVCGDGSGLAFFNLLNIANQVSGGNGQVNWYFDSLGNVIISNPEMFLSGDTVIYANVMAGTCISDFVPIELTVLETIVANHTILDLCGDMNGQITIDLTMIDTAISGNLGIVSWFGDQALTMMVSNPTAFVTGDTILYAIVSNGNCTSVPAGIIIFVSAELTANPLTLNLCKPQSDTLFIDLTQSDFNVSGGLGQVNWYLDALGTMEITAPGLFPGVLSQTIYANVTNGVCASPLVPVTLNILDEPVANSFAINKCGDTNGQINIDLTSVDTFISEKTGIVTWYADNTLTVQISNPSSFTSGDTLLYATVTNGFCISPSVAVTLSIVDNLTANPITIQECVLDHAIAMIDLTSSNFEISGGNGAVYWFTDALGADTITNPGLFATNGDTLFAQVSADGCTSWIVMIPIEISSSSLPVPVCNFTSIDSIEMAWSSVTMDYELNYSINGQPFGSTIMSQSSTFSLGGLGQGDTVTLSVTAIFDTICEPLTNSITCITEVCPIQNITFPGLQSAYCNDEPFILINANPPGGQLSGQGISGDTLYPNLIFGNNTTIFYNWEDNASGCSYNGSAQIQLFNPLAAPSLICQNPTLSSVTFEWTSVNDEFAYEYVVNHGPSTGVITTVGKQLIVNGLNEGDEVTMQLWTIGSAPCGNSDTVSITCRAKQCPAATLLIQDPGDVCSDDDPFQLNVLIQGPLQNPTITWSGHGIIDPSGVFNPSAAMIGGNIVSVIAEEGGCSYPASINIHIIQPPVASFELTGTPCVDSLLHLVFNGYGYESPGWSWYWNGDGAWVFSPNGTNLDSYIHWKSPGEYLFILGIGFHGCVDTFFYPITIDAPIDPPVITCLEEDYYSLVISWDPVVGASQYDVSSSLGNGKLSGTTYTITNLPDDTTVSITVTAIGPSACGPSTSTIECQTLDYIPPETFIADVFSPNGDGINDVLLIQTNSKVTKIHTFRIFDRWGNMVFEALDFLPNDQEFGWDGTFSGDEMNPGVYLYWTELETVYGKMEILTGDVTLLK